MSGYLFVMLAIMNFLVLDKTWEPFTTTGKQYRNTQEYLDQVMTHFIPVYFSSLRSLLSLEIGSHSRNNSCWLAEMLFVPR